MSKAKPKAKGTSRAGKPRKSAGTSTSPPTAGATGKAASRLIDQRISDLAGWRGETLARMRALILEADAEMTEEWKWMGTPVWSRHGIVCTGESYAKRDIGKRLDALILRNVPNVFRGTSLRPVPPGASMSEGTRYFDIHEGALDDAQMATWVKQAAALPGWVP